MPLHHFGRILLLYFTPGLITSCCFRKWYWDRFIFFFETRDWLCLTSGFGSVPFITLPERRKKKESLIREENDFRFFTETWAKFIYLPYLSLPAIPTAYRKATSKQTLMQCNEDMEMFLSRCSFTEYLDPLRLHKSCRRSWSLDFFKKCLIVFLHVGE